MTTPTSAAIAAAMTEVEMARHVLLEAEQDLESAQVQHGIAIRCSEPGTNNAELTRAALLVRRKTRAYNAAHTDYQTAVTTLRTLQA